MTEEDYTAELMESNSIQEAPTRRRLPRRQVYIPADDVRYSRGAGVENRVEPPPNEIDGDSLDRQRCIFDFDQDRIQQQTCLVLGAGGIGQNVGLTLSRLGVRGIIFVDKDTYEASNLSRQLLGSRSDIGKRKVDVAVEGILNNHQISPLTLQGCHIDAVVSWDKIVSLAQSSSVIFNGIDVGAVFDFAVNSLSKALSIPLVQGQSASWSVNSEFYSGQPGRLCGSCSTSIASSFALTGSAFKGINNRFKDWITAYADAIQSEIYTGAGIETAKLSADTLFKFLQQDVQYNIGGPTALIIIQEAIDGLNSCTDHQDRVSTSSTAGSDVNQCILFQDFEIFLQQYYKFSLQRLLPDKICSQTNIQFMPQPRGVPTRYIGSWVCPCLAVAAIMVSQWVNYLTGPTGKDPPSSFQLSLASCRTDICDTALECGFVDPPSQSSDPSSATCQTCMQTVSRLEEQLFYSLLPLALEPISGRVFKQIANVVKPVESSKSDNYDISETGTDHVSIIIDVGAAPSTDASLFSSVEIRRGKLWYNIDHLGTGYSNLAIDAIPCTTGNLSAHLEEIVLDG